MLEIILMVAFAAIFWGSVFWARSLLMKWLFSSHNAMNKHNDRVRELTWWAAIGVVSVFIAVADIIVKLLMATL